MDDEDRRVYIRALAIVLGVLGYLSPMVGLAIASRVDESAGRLIAPFGILASALLIAAACASFVAQVEPTANARSRHLRLLIGALAGLAPTAVFVVLRLWMKTCTGINVLALRWDPATSTIVHVAAAVVPILSTAALVIGLRRPDLYPAAKAMFVYSAIAVIPTTIGLFFSVYGDPGPNCVPV
jgi:hypothetical protein